MTVQYKRKEIRKQINKKVYGVWDPDWVVDNLEQVYAVWEQDNRATKTFGGALSTTLSVTQPPVTGTIVRTINYNVSVTTDDALVTQRKITRVAYFGAAKANQGCGFNTNDNTFLTTGFWPIYDCGTIWNYTWPYNTY